MLKEGEEEEKKNLKAKGLISLIKDPYQNGKPGRAANLQVL